ncbi:metallophosphoesterase family protein [Beijerinckia sp. L45]|uniref:metallophosphoesterase family protein n=1 Tax=Beijerinckia sp. L45 TaxID=1641855 RepID=UPI00131D7DEF|nr:metallophosphoesterase family protein [Beijerinckia sp. L45]
MTVFFTADTHFGDTRILNTAKRPFKTIGAHDHALIERWQEAVGPNDEVWHLGDFAPGYSAAMVGALLDALPGRKHLITGNNDDDVTRRHSGWTSVGAYAELKLNEVTCVLCHYAFRTWFRMGKGSLDLHGHSHGKLKPLIRQFDVGVDLWNFQPVTVETLLASRRRKKAAVRLAAAA